MVEEEEKAVFACELDKMRIEYLKCTDFSMRLQIEEHIALVQNALTITEHEPENHLNKT